MPSLKSKFNRDVSFNQDDLFYGVSLQQVTPRPTRGRQLKTPRSELEEGPIVGGVTKPVPIVGTTNSTKITASNCPCNTTLDKAGNTICPCIKIVRDKNGNPKTVEDKKDETKTVSTAKAADEESNPEFFLENGEERKYTGNFPWWLLPLIALGLILILLLLFCTMNRSKTRPAAGQTQRSAAKPAEVNEAAVEDEIKRQLEARVENNMQSA